MSIQFAGSKSGDDRRRRRLVVNVDDPNAEGTGDEGTSAPGVSSELVKSSAAAPWVPASEWRLWTYAALIGLVISAAAFVLATPISIRAELAPLTKHLLEGDRPALAVVIQTAFFFLCAQLSLLIGWYRAQCKLDFRGRYRVWPWAAAVFGLLAIASATNTHWLVGEIVHTTQVVKWRPTVVSWLVPLALVASPLVLLIDRDVRRSRSSLYTLRAAWLLSIASLCLELFASDLTEQPWAARARVIVPMFAVTTLFIGLWLHARVVAYICPDPPELSDVTIAGRVWVACGRLASRLVWKRTPKAAEAEAEVKPKRGRKKATTDEEEEAAPKRKRKAPAKRTTKPRTRKVAEVEEEEVEEEEPTYSEEAETVEAADSYETEETEEESYDWQEEEPTPPSAPVQSNRSHRESNSVPAPHFATNKSGHSAKNKWEEPEPVAESQDEDDSEDSDSGGSDGGSDPMRGLSKRQKRELRRQNKQRR